MNSSCLLVLAQHVAHVLAQETLDALAKLLHAIDVGLLHPPGAIRRIGRARLEFLDRLLHAEVPGDVGDQVADRGERVHRLDDHRHVQVQLAQPRHAHQLGHAVDLSGARTALAGLAVPAHRQVGRLLRLDAVDGIQHHHALFHRRLVILKLPAARIAAPDAEQRLHWPSISSPRSLPSTLRASAGWRAAPPASRHPAPRATTMLYLPHSGSLFGKSSRNCAPRLSFRSSAARVIASETIEHVIKIHCRVPAVVVLTVARDARPCRALPQSPRCTPSARCISSSVRTMPTRSCIES